MADQHTDISPGPMRLVLLADVRLYRESLNASLSSRPGFHVVRATASLDEALDAAARDRPDLLLLDMATRDSLYIARRIRDAMPDLRIVGLGVDEEREVLACAEAGMSGYVPSETSLEGLIDRLTSAHRGELLCTPKVAATLFRQLGCGRQNARLPSTLLLTAREREVLTLVDRGLSNKKIAIQLQIEVSTVKHHVHKLLEKLQVTSRAQAVARLGLHVTARRGGLTAASK